jgi:hypothetical protein
VIRHRCDNPPCIKVDHLELGTHADNVTDRESRGRGRTAGEWNHHARLTESEVVEMRRLRASGWLQKDLAKKFGVTQATVSQVCTGKTWRQVAS